MTAAIRIGACVLAVALATTARANPSCPGGGPRLDLDVATPEAGMVAVAIRLTAAGASIGATSNTLAYPSAALRFVSGVAGPATVARNGDCSISTRAAGDTTTLTVGCFTFDPTKFLVPYTDGVVAVLTFALTGCPPGGAIVITNMASAATTPQGTAVPNMCGLDGRIACAGACGDVNADGAVDIGDALMVAQYDVGARECGVGNFSRPQACDVNGDGSCDIGDALRLAQCDVGLIDCAFACRTFSCP